MQARDKHRETLLHYLSNWDNDFPSRQKMAEICKVSNIALRKHFTPADYAEIENTGLELRKKNSAKPRAKIYKALAEAGADGDVRASNLFLERTEGKVADKVQHTGKDGEKLEWKINVVHTNADVS